MLQELVLKRELFAWHTVNLLWLWYSHFVSPLNGRMHGCSIGLSEYNMELFTLYIYGESVV